MTLSTRNRKSIAFIVAAVVAGVFGIQFASASFSPSATATPTKLSNYGVARVETMASPSQAYTTYTVTINATQGPVYLEQLQLQTAQAAGASTLKNITSNGRIIWPQNLVKVTATSCSSGCYGELINAILNSFGGPPNSSPFVKDPVGNQAIVAGAGSSDAQSLRIQLTTSAQTPSGDALDAAALVMAPSTAKVTMSLSTP